MKFGAFVKVDESTEQKERFDVARVQLSISFMTNLNQELFVMIDGCKFGVKIEEEMLYQVDQGLYRHNQVKDEVETWSSDSGESNVSGPAMASIHGRSLPMKDASDEEETIQFDDPGGHIENELNDDVPGNELQGVGETNSHADLAATIQVDGRPHMGQNTLELAKDLHALHIQERPEILIGPMEDGLDRDESQEILKNNHEDRGNSEKHNSVKILGPEVQTNLPEKSMNPCKAINPDTSKNRKLYSESQLHCEKIHDT